LGGVKKFFFIFCFLFLHSGVLVEIINGVVVERWQEWGTGFFPLLFFSRKEKGDEAL